jgi:hypothetical protein
MYLVLFINPKNSGLHMTEQFNTLRSATIMMNAMVKEWKMTIKKPKPNAVKKVSFNHYVVGTTPSVLLLKWNGRNGASISLQNDEYTFNNYHIINLATK